MAPLIHLEREGGWEGGREGEREGGWEGGREGGRGGRGGGRGGRGGGRVRERWQAMTQEDTRQTHNTHLLGTPKDPS